MVTNDLPFNIPSFKSWKEVTEWVGYKRFFNTETTWIVNPIAQIRLSMISFILKYGLN